MLLINFNFINYFKLFFFFNTCLEKGSLNSILVNWIRTCLFIGHHWRLDFNYSETKCVNKLALDLIGELFLKKGYISSKIEYK